MDPEVACKSIKDPVDAFSTDVLVVVACIVLIVPVVDCRVGMVPEVACKLIKDPVDAFKTEVLVVVDRKSRITPTVESKLSVLI
jgi:uroporphyrinogen-III decarboxylase